MNDLSKCRILVVDDTESNVDLLVAVLDKHYLVSVAMDGETALKNISENKPDLILLDIMMPGMSGYEVCRILKTDPELADFPIIFLTAKTQLKDVIQGFELGAVDYITKPFNVTELLMRVNTHLELKMAREKIENQNEQLLKAAKFHEDVDRIIRHDLKTPLNPIISYPQLIIKREKLSERGIMHLKQVEEAGYKMLEMINLSLDLFKMEQGIYELQPAPVDVLQKIESVKTELEDLIRGKELFLNVEKNSLPIEHQDKFLILGEDLLCYSMLANLVKNALEASPEGESVTVRVDRKETAIISIHNKGAVPSEMRQNFFEKYATSGKKSGTGLGTYSAKLIVETLNGHIRMSSEAEDTTVIIELPLY